VVSLFSVAVCGCEVRAVCCGCLCFLQLGSACVVFWVAEMIWCVCWVM